MLLAAVPAGAEDTTKPKESYENFQMGRLELTDLKPPVHNMAFGTDDYKDGVEYERFTLVAQTARFVYYSEGSPSERRPLFAGKAHAVRISGLKSDLVDKDLEPVLRFDETDDLSFIFEPEIWNSESLFEGSLEVGQKSVWVGNRPGVQITPSTSRGTIYFHTGGVVWKKPHFEMPAPVGELSADFYNSDPEAGIGFELSLETGRLEMVSGKFRARDSTVERQGPEGLELATVEVWVDRDTVEVSVLRPETPGRVLGATIPDTEPMLTSGTFRAARFFGQAPRAVSRGVVTEIRVENPSFESAIAVAGLRNPYAVPEIREAVRGGRVKPPEIQRAKAIEDSLTQLEALDRVDFAVHLPAEDVLRLLRDAVGDLGPVSEPDIELAPQELVARMTFEPRLPIFDLPLPVELLLRVAPAIQGSDLVLRPSVDLGWLKSFQGKGVLPFDSLLRGLGEAFDKVGSEANGLEIRIPLDLVANERLDVGKLASSLGDKLSVEAKPVTVRARVPRAVLILDEAGIHIAGRLEVSL